MIINQHRSLLFGMKWVYLCIYYLYYTYILIFTYKYMLVWNLFVVSKYIFLNTPPSNLTNSRLRHWALWNSESLQKQRSRKRLLIQIISNTTTIRRRNIIGTGTCPCHEQPEARICPGFFSFSVLSTLRTNN